MARRTDPRRDDFGDPREFADALYDAGGPEYGRIDDLRNLPGERAEVMRAVYGASEDEFAAAVRAEERDLQRQRPYAFVTKWPSTRGYRKKRP